MKNKKKLIIIIAAVLAVSVLIVAGILYFLKGRSGATVDVYSMELLNSSSWFENDSQLSGTISSDYVQEVYPGASQEVEKVYVKQGDTVKEGDKLLKYNVEEQELDVQLQKLQIKAAKLEIEKMEEELQKLKGTKTVGAIDSSGSNLLSASLNLSYVNNTVLEEVGDMAENESSEEEATETTKSAAVKEGDNPLKDTITDKNEKNSGDGKTKDTPYVFLLVKGKNGATVKGTVIQSLLSNKEYAVFKEYESENAYNDNKGPLTTFSLTPDMTAIDLKSDNTYTLEQLKEIVIQKQLKDNISAISDAASGEGSEGSHFIFLMADNGKVKGSVILELIKNEYYAYFREYTSEDAYATDKKNPVDQLEVRPQYLTNGVLEDQEYNLDDLKNLVKEAPKTNVLKSTISDKQKDAASGDGSASNPYVYLLIQNGTIRGSVVNDIMTNQQYAVFYEYESEEVYKAGTDKNPVQISIRPGMIFKESLSSFAGYTITDLNNIIVTADKIEITPSKKKVKTGKSYTFKAKLTGKNKEALTVTWELKRNKSKSTKLVNGVLTVGADESAKTLRIVARAGDKKDVLTLTVEKSSTGSSTSSSGGSTVGSSDSGGDFGDAGESYTAEDLKDAISEKEDEIAQAKQDLSEARINYKEAKKEVDAATVKAKVSGKVTLAYTADAMPTDGSAAIIVRAEDGMYVKTSVSEMDLDTIQVGGTIRCTSWETGEEYEAVVKDISDFPTSESSSEGMSNPNSSYYPIVAYIEDADGLSTGESVSISYSSQSMGTVSEDAIYLQKAYIRTEGRQSYVYKEGKNGRLTKQYIKTGETIYGQYVEVLSGITMDDNLAFPYGKNVKEGAKVQLSEDEDDIIY